MSTSVNAANARPALDSAPSVGQFTTRLNGRPRLVPALGLWRRDMLRFGRDRGRWLGVVLQPLVFWALIGLGLDGHFASDTAPGEGYAHYFFPGVVCLTSLFTAVFATISLIEDRQSGIVRLALTGPASAPTVALSRVASVTTLGVLQAFLVLMIAPLAGYSLLHLHWPSLIATLVLGTASLASLGTSLAWVLRSTHAYHALMSVALIPLWIVSGAMFPVPPGVASTLSIANPVFHMANATRNALAPHGADVGSAAASPMLALVLCTLLCVGLAAFVAHWRPQ